MRGKVDGAPLVPLQGVPETFHDVGQFETVAGIARALADDRAAAWRDTCGDRFQQSALIAVVDVVEEVEHDHVALELDRFPRVLMDEARVLVTGLRNLLCHCDSASIPIDTDHP